MMVFQKVLIAFLYGKSLTTELKDIIVELYISNIVLTNRIKNTLNWVFFALYGNLRLIVRTELFYTFIS